MEEKINIKQKTPSKSPILAAFLSLLPGVGSLYNGYYIKGILQLIIFAGLVSAQSRGGQPFIGILLAGYIFYAIFDAAHDAQEISSQHEIGGETKVSLEAEVKVSRPSGSISWGIILIALGGLFLLANFDVISYDSFIRFWPLALVGLGIKLIFDYYASKKS